METMEINYDNLPILQGDYLDLLKKSILETKKIKVNTFYKDKIEILSKIMFLAWQKKLTKNELFNLLNYIPTNDKVLELVYNYKGVSNRSIILQAVSVLWNVLSIETAENEIQIEIEKPPLTEQTINHSELDDIGLVIPLKYNDIYLTSLLLGNQSTNLIISFIKLFLPIGVYLNISYGEAINPLQEIKVGMKEHNAVVTSILNKIYI